LTLLQRIFGRKPGRPADSADMPALSRWAFGGTAPSACLLDQLSPTQRAAARSLAYRLYTLCERQGRADEARHYNALVAAWPELYLPKGLRRAWEDRHPALRAARLASLMPDDYSIVPVPRLA
jgi:hypothetical protein